MSGGRVAPRIGGVGARGSRPYRKRRPLPAIILIVVLGTAAAVLWGNVAADEATIDDDIRCTPAATPAAGVTLTPVAYHALDGISPLPPGDVSVRVLNASNTFGQAGRTTEKLRELGFGQLGEAGNDPAYSNSTADCRGQIRFGAGGKAAARTISLLAPCLELIRTNGDDGTVELVTGSEFRGIDLDRNQQRVLDTLDSSTAQQNATGGGEQAAGSNGPSIDPQLLNTIRDGSC